MAKAPRKQMAPTKGPIGGKNLANLKKLAKFSLIDSDDDEDELNSDSSGSDDIEEDEDEDEEEDEEEGEEEESHYAHGDSESSLTAVSDEDEALYRAGIAQVTLRKGLSRGKGVPVQQHGAAGSGKGGYNYDSDDNSDEEESTSGSDSDVDFVELRGGKSKIRTFGSNARKGTKSVKGKSVPRKLHRKMSIINDDKTNGRRRSSSSFKGTKFGRRKSEVALPDDINFLFEFEDLRGSKHDNAVFDDSDTSVVDSPVVNKKQIAINMASTSSVGSGSVVDEDIGEEINFDFPKEEAVFFDEDLPVPKIKDEEINSDEDYELDDNELLATLQADNDEFDLEPANLRKNSMASVDEEDDPFLKEEEKFLVNEFENNGFDEEDPLSNSNIFNMHGGEEEQVMEYESDDNDLYDDDDLEDQANEDLEVIDLGFDDKTVPDKKISRLKRPGSDEDDDSYLWNYFFLLNELLLENEEVDIYRKIEKRGRQRAAAAAKGLPSQEVDLEMEEKFYDLGELTDEDLLLPQSGQKMQSHGQQKAKEVLDLRTADYRPPVLGTWVAIDSKPFGIIDGLLTRTLQHGSSSIDTNNGAAVSPRSTKDDHGVDNIPRRGLSSKATLYATGGNYSDSDDLAMGLDELLNVSELDDDDENDVKIWQDFNKKRTVPLGAFRNKSILQQHIPHMVRVGGFGRAGRLNSSSGGGDYLGKHRGDKRRDRRHLASEKKSGGGAFKLHGTFGISGVSKAGGERKNVGRKASLTGVVDNGPSLPLKAKRRRASVIEAVSEGLRPTKNGLFSENTLADVEEIMGDDHEFMALIKGI